MYPMEQRDFAIIWFAVQALLDGVDPSDPAAFRAFLGTHGFPTGPHTLFLNPPWSLALLLIFAPLSLGHAITLNHIINLCACAAPIPLLLPSRRSLIFAAPLLMLFSPLIDLSQQGQITGLSLLCLGGGVALTGAAPFAAGFFIGLSSVKAHLFLPVYTFLCVSSIRRGQYQLPLGILASVALQWSVVVALNAQLGPSSLGSNLMTTYLNPTPGAWLHYLTGVHWLRYLPSGIGCLGVAFVALRTEYAGRRMVDQLPWLLCCALLSAPYAWSYDFILLIPALTVIAYAASINRSALVPYFMALAANILLLCTRIQMAYTAWYPLLVTLLYMRVVLRTPIPLGVAMPKN